MRGSDKRTGELFSCVGVEERAPKAHPLRLIRRIVNDVLAKLDGEFAELYADDGRCSIAPDRLLRAVLLQVFYTVRSERQALARPMLRGVNELGFKFIWTMSAYDLIRLPKLIGAVA